MGIGEAFRTALGSIRANKLRSALTLLGMVIGVFAIIASVTAVAVIDVYFKEALSFLGQTTFFVDSQLPPGQEERHRRAFTYDEALLLEARLQVPGTVSTREGFDALAVRSERFETEPNVQVMGGDEHYVENFGWELHEGRGLTETDVRYARPVALLGKDVAELLFPNEEALGKTVTAGGVRYQVVGVLAERGSIMGWSQDNVLVAPITRLFDVYGGRSTRDLSDVAVRVPTLMEVQPAQEQVIGLLRVIRRLEAGEPNNFMIDGDKASMAELEGFTAGLTMAGFGIGAIALLAAGIGVMNIMLVSVTERTREIGLRKSVGARPRDVLRQFLLEAVFLCLVGGFLGVLLGLLGGNLMALQFGISAAFPLGWALVSVVMVTIVAVVFGGYPAYKAARLSPIEALRRD